MDTPESDAALFFERMKKIKRDAGAQGEKVFYFVPPTPAHLAAYKRWMASSSMHETFLGDVVDGACYRVALHQGQTLLIPTGWIHAVFTPVDSLVFGGNFLHSLNIALQLECVPFHLSSVAQRTYSFSFYLYADIDVDLVIYRSFHHQEATRP